MRKSGVLLGTVVSLALAATASSASAAIFAFTFSGDNPMYNASGILKAISNGDGTYTAVGGTISDTNLSAVEGVLIPNPNAPGVNIADQFAYDDQLLPGQPQVITVYGLLFDFDGAINLFAGDNNGYLLSTGVDTMFGSLTLTEISSSVPEPASWAMMLAGFGIIGFVARRQKITVSYA